MARFADPDALLRTSKAEKKLLDSWKEGVNLQERTGRSLEELRNRATADRLALAVDFRRRGDRLIALPRPHYRDAVSRFYYAMYHAMRATIYFVHGGDDYEEHAKLPGKTPPDLQNGALWQNALKDARTVRNAADYDPYPKADTAWRGDAVRLSGQAEDLLTLCSQYLLGKGCQL